jgi:hypothetical protein
MKFTIPFNMRAFLAAGHGPACKPTFGSFVWGYRVGSPVVLTGRLITAHKAFDYARYTIELLDGGHIDVDDMVAIPDQFLPYVVACDNKVHRVQRVTGDIIMTTLGREFEVDEVQPVLYRIADEAKRPSEPELPNRVREEGV